MPCRGGISEAFIGSAVYGFCNAASVVVCHQVIVCASQEIGHIGSCLYLRRFCPRKGDGMGDSHVQSIVGIVCLCPGKKIFARRHTVCSVVDILPDQGISLSFFCQIPPFIIGVAVSCAVLLHGDKSAHGVVGVRCLPVIIDCPRGTVSQRVIAVALPCRSLCAGKQASCGIVGVHGIVYGRVYAALSAQTEHTPHRVIGKIHIHDCAAVCLIFCHRRHPVGAIAVSGFAARLHHGKEIPRRVIGVLRAPAFRIRYAGQTVISVIGIVYHTFVRIANGSSVPNSIIRIADCAPVVVGHAGQPSQHIALHGHDAVPVLHLHQLAALIVTESCLSAVMVSHLQGLIVEVVCHGRYIAVLIRDPDRIAVTIVGITSLLFHRVYHTDHASPLVILIDGCMGHFPVL